VGGSATPAHAEPRVELPVETDAEPDASWLDFGQDDGMQSLRQLINGDEPETEPVQKIPERDWTVLEDAETLRLRALINGDVSADVVANAIVTGDDGSSDHKPMSKRQRVPTTTTRKPAGLMSDEGGVRGWLAALERDKRRAGCKGADAGASTSA